MTDSGIEMCIRDRGNTTRDISDALYEQFGNRISAETISAVTDRVLPEVQSWKNRTLDAVYPIVWLDALHYKVMDDKQRPVSRAVYNAVSYTHLDVYKRQHFLF